MMSSVTATHLDLTYGNPSYPRFSIYQNGTWHVMIVIRLIEKDVLPIPRWRVKTGRTARLAGSVEGCRGERICATMSPFFDGTVR
jgi:hypothetical protein